MIGRLVTRGAKCRSCRCPVAWAKTQNGKMIPLDPEPVREGGNVDVTGSEHTPRGIVLRATVYGSSLHADAARHAAVAEGRSLYVAHFTICPHASEHRKRAS